MLLKMTFHHSFFRLDAILTFPEPRLRQSQPRLQEYWFFVLGAIFNLSCSLLSFLQCEEMISSNGNDFQPSFTTGSNQKVFFRCETLEMILTKMISNVLEMRISCQKKTFPFGNDFFEMIYCHKKWFLAVFGAKKWFTGAKNHFLPFRKWFFTQENDFEGTQKWFPWNDFWNILRRFWRCDLLLGKKPFPAEMGISGNGWKSFFSRKCSTTSNFWYRWLSPNEQLRIDI